MENTLILAQKLRNRVRKKMGKRVELKFSLHNILINGQKRGCSGFIRNTVNNSVVYVNTEQSSCKDIKYLYRYADDEKDYTGYRNRFAGSLDGLVDGLAECLIYPKSPDETGPGKQTPAKRI